MWWPGISHDTDDCALGVSLHDHSGGFQGVSLIALPVHLHNFIRHFKASCYNGQQCIKSEFKIFVRLRNLKFDSCRVCTAYSFNIVLPP